jgi:MFS transporter, DHA3 family, macrolide efflux protein
MVATAHPNERQTNSMVVFWFIWAGQVFSGLGSSIAGFAMTWYLTEQTGSATILAAAMGAQIIPQVLLGPLAGALVDRWSRRWVMIGADGLGAALTVILVTLFSLGNVQLWQILAVMFLRASAGIFHWAAMQSTTPLMVPQQHLPRVAGLNSAINGASGIVAPALGAMLFSLTTLPVILSLEVITAGIAILPLLLVFVPQPVRSQPDQEGEGAQSVLADMKFGLRYVWQWPGLRMVVLLAVVVNLMFTPMFALLPVLVTQRFDGSVGDLAVIQAAWGIGLAVGGLALGAWGGFKRRIVTSMLGLAVMSVSTAIIGFAPANFFSLAVGGMLVSGLMHPMVSGPLFAILQSVVPSDLQGRVLTLVISLGTAMVPLSLALAGPLSDAVGPHLWYILSGVISLAAALAGLSMKAVMKIEEGREMNGVR